MNEKIIKGKYSSVAKIIDEDYKGYNKPFALKHYIQRLQVGYRYSYSSETFLKIVIAYQLYLIHTERKDIHYKNIKDWQIIAWPVPKVISIN